MVVEKELSFKSNKIQLDGNLCLPDNNKPKAVVLLLPGSGPVDRDENVKNGISKFISNNLKTIAYQLAKHKIASFRYDKRGVNKTKALDKDVGFNDILNDARNAVEFLKNHKELTSSDIYILGHSEGGAVGTIISAENKDVKGFIAIASPIRDFDKTVLNQITLIIEKRTKSKEKTEKFITAFENAFLLMRKNKNWEDIDEKELKDIFSNVSFAFKILPKKTIKKIIKKQLRPKWFMESFEYDFEKIASNIKCPVLLIFGLKDYQVPVEEGRNLEMIIKKNGNLKVILKEIPDLNHMLRYNPGEMDPKSSIKSIKDDFDKRVLELLDEWFDKID